MCFQFPSNNSCFCLTSVVLEVSHMFEVITTLSLLLLTNLIPSCTGHVVERSETPVKKLKKKKKLLRKNKLAPSDDEFEMSDVQSTPKKAVPWVKTTSSNRSLKTTNSNRSIHIDQSDDDDDVYDRTHSRFYPDKLL